MFETKNVQTVRPLRIAERARRLAQTSADKESLMECATEIERLYGLLQEALALAGQGLKVASGR